MSNVIDAPNIDQVIDEIPADHVGGVFTLEVIRDGRNGPEVIARRVTPNLIVNVGKKQIWRMSSGLSTKLFKFMRCGINSAAAASGDTNVKTAITGTLKTATTITIETGRTFMLVISYPSGAGSKSATFKEVAVLNQLTSPGGSALARAVFTNAVKTTADKVRVTYRSRVT